MKDKGLADRRNNADGAAMYRHWRNAVVIVGLVTPLLGISTDAAPELQRSRAEFKVQSLPPDDVSTSRPVPLTLPDSALEPINWNALGGWAADDHAAAFATFLASCRPLLRTSPPQGTKRPMYLALLQVCRQAFAAGRLSEEQARLFFERNFRPLRITKLGDSAGLLTGYYEPIVDGSRFPTGIFKVPIYRRPPDLVPPRNSTGPGFPNRGQSLRRTPTGALVPYYDRGEILDGVLDGKHLEICWIKNQADALGIQIEGSARIRLEDGAIIRINYDAHNGYPFVPVSRILIERHIIPRNEMSPERIHEWMRANPQSAEEVLRQNRSFVFFRIVGLSDDRTPKDVQSAAHEREAVGAEGVPLTPERSIAIDNALHVYGTPFFIDAHLPLSGEKQSIKFDRLMIAQDTGSAIVGPARADIFWGAGDRAGLLAGRVHHPGNFAMLVPRELDPVTAGARMPLPPVKPQPPVETNAETRAPRLSAGLWHPAQLRRSAHDCSACKTAEAGPGGRANPMNTNRLPSRQPELLNFKGGRFSSSTNNTLCKSIRFRGSSSCHPAIFRLTKITTLRGR
jgi:membrane-bound lytic murein transglycosylase A